MYVRRNLNEFQAFDDVTHRTSYQTRNANKLFIPSFTLPHDVECRFIASHEFHTI